eukprot:TRINITY_DN59933_c0_g1_i1.p1 TRINITY_DN59933_c0_g1~~TRINITY_DN59933_c0_g1_i1.p1  ORF type:complete len:409 (-),score=48.31 TRINITY_DN59933_c0_g1_i1:82-1308(-)
MQLCRRRAQTILWLLAIIHTSASQASRLKPGRRHSTAAFLHVQTPSAAGGCLRCHEAKQVGNLDTPLVEASGLQASSKNPGVFYTMDDGPKKPFLYMVDRNGKLLGNLFMDGLNETSWEPHSDHHLGDWESLALGPCAVGSSESCIYIADIGNNCARTDIACPYMRKDNIYSLIRVPEPSLAELDTANRTITVTSTRLNFKYPDGPHDAETLIMASTGKAYVVTKDPNISCLYELPAAWSDITDSPSALPNATKLASLEAVSGELVTDGDFLLDSTGGVTGLTIRTYNKVLHYPLQLEQEGAGSQEESKDLSAALAKAVSKEPCQLALPKRSVQIKGEGLTWEQRQSNSQFKLLLCGEGAASPILEVMCEAPVLNELHSASRRALVSASMFLTMLAATQAHSLKCLLA